MTHIPNTVREEIEKDFDAHFDQDTDPNDRVNGWLRRINGDGTVSIARPQDLKEWALRIAAISRDKGYARGVEDSAKMVGAMFSVLPSGGIHDFHEDEELISKENTIAAIRALIPNKDTV